MKGFSFLIITIFAFVFSSQLYSQKVYDNRDEIPAEYKWDLSDIYKNWNDWEAGLKELQQKMDEIVSYKGKLKESPANLLKVKKLDDELGILSYKVYRYPQLTRDLDTRNQEMNAKLQQVQIIFAKFNTATSWINPEMLEIPWDTMKKWLEDPEFKPYRFGIEDLYRQQAHVLDESKETLLSYFTRLSQSPNDIYTNLSTADVDFPTITLSNGDKIQVTNGNYSRVLATNYNQEDRKNTFEAHYGVYKANENTYAAIYNAVFQKDWAEAQARNYKSCLESYLDGNNIPVAVYENLVNTVKANTEPLKRYAKLRKKVLGLKEYHSYDGSIPLTDFNKTYPYNEAKKWVLASVKPLGKDYQSKMATALKGGWIDVYENKGKRSGAYSAGVYGVHPYMLMNYNETLDNVFTLGHELGHTMHTLLSDENQPFATSDYTIFVAEVASTFNEDLLLDYLLTQTKDPKERINLLQEAIRGITGTFYFQTLLADFELQTHELVENGKPITAEVLNKIMDDLFNTYYGDTYAKDEILDRVWARIPHIYRTPFYVYQYATCFASSAKLHNDVTTGSEADREAAKERYLNLLKSGGSDYPMEELKKAGVDLTKPETVNAVINLLDKLVTQLEEEINKLDKK
ncbi:MAG: oligoendopeptidase F [Ignavibacteriaceae bacterium]